MKRQIIAVVTLLCTAGAANAQDRYTVVDLGVPTAPDGDAYGGISNAGAVVGSYALGNGDRHAFVYDPARGGFLDLGTLGGNGSRGNGMNAAGMVVGRSTTASGALHAFRHSAAAGLEDIHALVSLGGMNSSALAIEDNGEILGWSETASGQRHAFSYDPSTGALTDLQVAAGWPATQSAAYDRDASSGYLVGVFENPAGASHGFAYSAASGFIDMGTLGGSGSALFRARNSVAVGTADVDGSSWHAVQFQPLGLFDLGGLGGTSTAFDINGAGQIVGGATDANGDARAFVYDNARGMRDVNALITDPNWYLLEAQGINDAGQIVGTGYYYGYLRIFLLTPVVPDTTPPVLALPLPISLDATSPAGAVVNYLATAVDGVDGPVAVACLPAPGFTFPIGTTTVACSAIDHAGNPASGTFPITVLPSPASQPIDLGTYSIGEVWAQLRGEFTWAIDPANLPPTGLSLRTETPLWFPADAHAGIIGIMAAPGTYTFTLLRSGVQWPYRITIVGLAIKDYWTLPDAFVNDFYTYHFTALNAVGSPQWEIDPETLPPGMSVDAAGVLSGTPSTPGAYQMVVEVADGGVTASRQITLRVYNVRITTPGLLPNATEGASYHAAIAAAGGTAPYTFRADNLPPGLELHQDGIIDGAPQGAEGHWWFNVTATDANQVSYTKVMSLVTVGARPRLPGIRPYDGELQDCSIGSPCSGAVWVSEGGRAPFEWTATGLPTGMSIRPGSVGSSWIAPANVEIWGTPTEVGTFQVRLRVKDADGRTATNTFPLRVRAMRLFSYLPGGTVGTPFSHRFMVIGGRLPYTAALAGGRLPFGLTLDPATLTVSGTPAEDGNFRAVFEFTDADGNSVRVPNFFSVGTTATVRILDDDEEGGWIQAGEFLSSQFTACCAASYNWSFDGTLPPGLSVSPDGVISGTPPPGTAGTFTFRVRAADGSNAANASIRQFTVTVTPLTVSNNLPMGEVGASYTGSVSAAGGSGVTWSLEPFEYMPPGLTIQPNGAIVGTPTESGRFGFELRATDAAHSLTWSFTIDIYPTGAIPLDMPFGPDLWTAVGPTTYQLQATGGTPPYSYSLSPNAPAIPGMRLQNGQPLPTYFPAGVAVGLIGVAATPGSYPTSIRVTDSLGQILDRAITLNVVPIRVVSQTTPPKALVGAFYVFDQTAYGGGAYNWQASDLPAGLDIDHVTGRIFGTPSAAGTFFPSITVTDPGTSLSDRVTLTLTVNPYAIFTNWALPTGFVGSHYNKTLDAPGCGAPCFWSPAGGRLPFGLSVVSTGSIDGTPTETGTFTFSVQVSGSSGSVQKVFSIRVAAGTPQPLAIAPASPPDITIGTTAAFALIAQGGIPPYQWSVLPGAGGADPLPPGVTLETPGETLGATLTAGVPYLTGRPMQAGGYDFTLQVTDGAGTTRQRAFSWNVSTLSSQYGNLPLAGNPLVYNIPYTQPLLVMGGTGPYTFTSGAMPPGLSLPPTTGVVTGTPANTGLFAVTVQAVDAGGNSISGNLNIAVSGPTATTLGFAAGPNLGTVQRGDAPTFVIGVIGGTAPYTLTALSPLPPGFVGTWTAPGATGPYAVTGIATTAGVHAFTLQAQDAAGNIGVRTFTLAVAAFAVPTPELPDATVGVPYSVAAYPPGVPPLTWSSTGPMPGNLSISGDGVISGTPTTAGTFTLPLQASDGTSAVAVRPMLRVSNLAITSARTLPIAIVGSPFTFTFTASGGASGKNWFADGLPHGLSMSPSGTIDGTPAESGTFNLDVWVSDGGQPAYARFALFVRHPNAEVLDITTPGPLPEVVAGRYGWIQLDAQGGVPPYQWMLAPGSAPPPGGALISGSEVPPALGATPGSAFLIGRVNTPGSYSFEVMVMDAAGTQARKTFTLKVSSVGWVTAGQLPAARTGAAYRADVFGVGGIAPYTFSATAENTGQKVTPLLDGALGYTLLPGLTLTPAGVIHGTPASTGFYRFILHVKDAAGLTYAAPIELTVASGSGLVVTTRDPEDIPVGNGGSPFDLNAVSFSGSTFTYSWSVIDGALPPGMMLVAGGYAGPDTTAVAGRPATEGTYSFTVRATSTSNESDTADHVFTIHVTPFHIVSPAVAFESHVPGGHVGEPYSTTIKVAGGTAPGFFVTDGTTLPPGLTLSSNGVLSGTPTHAGQHTVALTIKDLAGHVTDATLPLEITPAGAASPLIAADDLEPWFPATNGAPYLFDLDVFAVGGSGALSWSLAAGSALPPGLTILSGGNGVPAHLGGIPTSDGEFGFSLTVSDATGQTLTIPVTLFILPAEARVIADSLPAGLVGVPYSARVIAPVGEGDFTSELLPFLDLPPGLMLNGSTLAGTPQAPGNFVIAVRFVNVAAQWDVVRLYLVTIDNAAGQAPAVSLLPNPVSIYYEIGSPSPAPTRVFVQTTTGSQPVQLHLSGAPWGSLDAVSGTASTQVNLNVTAGGLAAGTYFAMLGAYAPGAVNADPVVPVLLNVSVAPTAAPGVASPMSPTGIIADSRPIFRWSAAASAGYYLLSIEDGSGARNDYWYRPAEAGCADGIGSCAVLVPRALAAGAARWKVLTWNAAAYGPWSAVANVFVHLSNGSLAAPVVVGPSGATPTRTPSYVWNTVAGATWYLVAVTDAAGTTREYPAAPTENCNGVTCTVTPDTSIPLGASQWRVRAGNAAGGGAWSAPIDFTVTDPAGPPGKPVLVSPVLGASLMALPVTFTWSAVAETSWYVVRVLDRDNVTQDFWYRPYAADCAFGVGTCRVSRPDIKPGPGKWQVLAWNPAGYSPWSDTAQYWLEIADPAAGVPQPVSPAGPTMSALVQYQWSAVPGAVGYRVMIHHVGSPVQYAWITPADAGCAGGAACVAAIGISVTAGVDAEWQVQAWTGNGHGDWSALSPFTIALIAPARPTLVSPEGPSNAAPSFTWNASANVAYYYIQVDDPTGRRVDRWLRPAEVGCGAGTGHCTLTPGVSLASGAGSWQVIAWNPAGYSPWSLPHAFTVP